MGIFKHLFWIAPVAMVVLLLTIGQQRETGAQIDAKQSEIHSNVSAILSETTDDPELKKRYKAQMQTADQDTADAKALLKERQAENDQTAAEMNQAMKEIDQQLKAGGGK